MDSEKEKFVSWYAHEGTLGITVILIPILASYLIYNDAFDSILTILFCSILGGGVWLLCSITLLTRYIKKCKNENK